jgi:hypothetical protein
VAGTDRMLHICCYDSGTSSEDVCYASAVKHTQLMMITHLKCYMLLKFSVLTTFDHERTAKELLLTGLLTLQ